MSAVLERADLSVNLPLAEASSPPPPHSFAEWRQAVLRRGAVPVIAVAGSRGKTTVVRLLDAIFADAGLRTATWTDAGVEIRRRRQRSELGAWGLAMRRLAAGSLDVAVQELDWPTVHAVGLPTDAYPVAAVTNICANNERCLIRPETKMAIRAYQRVRGAARRDGALVLNGDDYAVAGTEVERETPAILVGLNPEAPILRAHLSEGGGAAWVDDGWITVGNASIARHLCPAAELPFGLKGAASFAIHNALLAAAITHVCGIDADTIARALERFQVPTSAAGSFNLVQVGEATAIVDRPAPSWFLRSALRAVRHLSYRRLVVVAGSLAAVPDDDLAEVGRLLARAGDALVLHSQADGSARMTDLIAGIETPETPLVLLKLETERQAIAQAIKLLRPGDVLFVLADQPAPVLTSLLRAKESPRLGAGQPAK